MRLGALEVGLIDAYVRWDNDPRIMEGHGRAEPVSRAERLAGLHAQMSGDNAHFTVYDGEDLPIGTITLAIDHAVRTAEFFIALGPEGRGRGLAAPATRAALDHAFNILRLHNVMLTVLAPNTPAVRAYRRAGFSVVGTRRNSGIWNGERCNELLMDAIPPTPN